MDQISALAAALGIVLAATVAAYMLGSRRIAPMLGALFAGPACYFVIGVAVPRITGEGHFFSVPFGGLRIGDIELVLSLLAWMLAWWALLRYVATAGQRR
jgi:hypothetical protein